MSDEAIPPRFDEAFQAGFQSLLAWRRDVRHFRRDPLPVGTIDRLIATASLTPSVGNAQPWRFVRIETAEVRAALADHVDAASRRAAEAYDPDRAAAYRALKLHGLREAPVILGAFSDDAPAAGHGLGIATMPEMLRYSTVMAIHTLWLAARVQDIGVGWVSVLEPSTAAALLDVPKDWTMIAVLCLGYPEHPSMEPELQVRRWQDRLEASVIDR